jgi:hypothetical protein
MFSSFKNWAEKPVRSESLGVFRVLFGLITLWEVIYLYRIDFLEIFIFGPSVLFSYDFLPVTPISKSGMEVLLAGLGISCVLIVLGVFYRLALSYFLIVFSYFFLLDKGLYNNHLYLISLIAFLMLFLNANSSFTINKKGKSEFIPQWQIRILQFQLAVVFFYGGLAKVNPYWLNLHPVQEILEYRAINSGVDFITGSFFQYLIMIGGLIFDMSIPFFLWFKKTRIFAIGAALIFNITNSWIFDDINIFPYFMIAALILYLDDEELSKLPFIKEYKSKTSKSKFNLSKPTIYFLAIYISIQALLPLRHYLYPGYVDWTGDGQRFAWRMKIQQREIKEMKFAIFDIDKREIHEIDPKNHLNLSQYQQLPLYPRMIVQFAQYLKEFAAKKEGIRNVMVKCRVKVTFNGSEPSYIFDPQIDLIEGYETHAFFDEWIEPAPLVNN